jgi:hypothetical protein
MVAFSKDFLPSKEGGKECEKAKGLLSQARRVAERSVSRQSRGVILYGDIRSENADMSNEKSCGIHDRRKSKVFHKL